MKIKLPFVIISRNKYRELLADREYMKRYRESYIELTTNKNPKLWENKIGEPFKIKGGK